MDIINEQWSLIQHLFTSIRVKKVGRPTRHPRDILNGIFWIFRTGAQWSALPDRYPPYQTCHRWYRRWCADGTLAKTLELLSADLILRETQVSGNPESSNLIIHRSVSTDVQAGKVRSWMHDTQAMLNSPYARRVMEESELRRRNETTPIP